MSKELVLPFLILVGLSRVQSCTILYNLYQSSMEELTENDGADALDGGGGLAEEEEQDDGQDHRVAPRPPHRAPLQ